jgi:hypothetical protein
MTNFVWIQLNYQGNARGREPQMKVLWLFQAAFAGGGWP